MSAPRRSPVREKPIRLQAAAPAASPVRLAASGGDGLSDRFFRHMVFNLRNGVVAITRDGRVAVMNDIAYQVLGLASRAGDVGRPFTEVLSGCPEVAHILSNAFDTDDLPNRAEMRLRKTGTAIGYTLSRIHDDSGQQVGATMFFKDLTRVEQLVERERLRDRLAALGEMAAAIAHEVKNPLASIEVMAGVLKRQLSDRIDALETLDDIIKEVKMANAIVVEVLEFVRPIQLQLERVSVSDVIRDSIAASESKMPPGIVRFDVRVEQDVPSVMGDSHQLRQLFTNLLMNAYEAFAGEGLIEIAARLETGDAPGAPGARGPQVVVEVRDNGPGVAPDNLDRIFSPFFTTKPQGTGLGLAIVRKVVDAHDGRIDATSAPGRTTFRITLPVARIEDSAGDKPQELIHGTDSRR